MPSPSGKPDGIADANYTTEVHLDALKNLRPLPNEVDWHFSWAEMIWIPRQRVWVAFIHEEYQERSVGPNEQSVRGPFLLTTTSPPSSFVERADNTAMISRGFDPYPNYADGRRRLDPHATEPPSDMTTRTESFLSLPNYPSEKAYRSGNEVELDIWKWKADREIICPDCGKTAHCFTTLEYYQYYGDKDVMYSELCSTNGFCSISYHFCASCHHLEIGAHADLWQNVCSICGYRWLFKQKPATVDLSR